MTSTMYTAQVEGVTHEEMRNIARQKGEVFFGHTRVEVESMVVKGQRSSPNGSLGQPWVYWGTATVVEVPEPVKPDIF